MKFMLALLMGAATGVISAWGIGGGTLLVVCMTCLMGVEQRAAQGINLLYFLPASGLALISHLKNKLVRWKTVWPAIVCGAPCAALAAWVAADVDAGALRKIFGVFVASVGVFEFFAKPKAKARP